MKIMTHAEIIKEARLLNNLSLNPVTDSELRKSRSLRMSFAIESLKRKKMRLREIAEMFGVKPKQCSRVSRWASELVDRQIKRFSEMKDMVEGIIGLATFRLTYPIR